MTQKKSNQATTQGIPTFFKEWYPIIEKAVFVFVAVVSLVITVRLTPIFKSIDNLTSRVEALERDNTDVKSFIKLHTDQQQAEALQLERNGVLLQLMTDYFHLTPKEQK